MPVEGHREDVTLVAGERVRQLARFAVNTLTVWNVKGHRGDATGEVAEPAQCSLMRTTSLSLETHLFVFQGIDRAWPAPGSASAPARQKLGWEGAPLCYCSYYCLRRSSRPGMGISLLSRRLRCRLCLAFGLFD